MTTATTNGNGRVAGAQFRTIALSRIRVREGFNPRGQRDAERTTQLNGSVAHEGILTPIIVAPDGDDYVLVAGERRYDAAVASAQVEVPAIVREVDEATGGLEIAMAENLAREEMDPVAEARGFGRLREARWSVKKIADYFKVKQAHVKRRLQILEVDEQLHPEIADGSIPLGAIPALAQLAQINRELPAAIASRIGVTARSWSEPLSWADVTKDPVGSLIAGFGTEKKDLPPDVYLVGDAYPLARFTLTEKAQKDLKAYAKLQAEEIANPLDLTIRFRVSDVEQAKALRAAFSNEHDSAHIIVGQDVADQLACDQIAEALKATRAMIRSRKKMAKTAEDAQAAAGHGPPTTEAPTAADQARIEEQERAEAAAERERQERERLERERQREEAEGFNVQLGHAVFKHLARLRVDADVLKLLTSIEFSQMLPELAARGMRYGYPGWPIEPEKDSKDGKRTYLSIEDAGKRASEWLAQAKSAPEVAGRLVSILVMARYAQQQPLGVAPPSYFRFDDDELLPWGGELLDMIDRLCKDRLPANLTKPARRELAEQRAKARREERERAQATKRLEDVDERIAEMSAQEREQVIADARLVYGFEGRRYRIEQLVRDTPLPDTDAEADAAESEPPAADEQVDDNDAAPEVPQSEADGQAEESAEDADRSEEPEPVAQAA